MVLSGESGSVSANDLDHLVLGKGDVAARARARRVGEQLGRIITALKPQSAALDWCEGSNNEQVTSTDEIKLGGHFGGWLDLVVMVEAEAGTKVKKSEWFDFVVSADVVINKYARPFDGMSVHEQDAEKDTTITFTPLDEPNTPDDLPFQPYGTTSETGRQLEACDMETAIGVLAIIADHVEAQVQAQASAPDTNRG